MPTNNRPRRADGEATHRRIIESGGELFAEQGFANTTSKQVATRAKVDLASINYHFGGRSGLYQAVLAEAHGRLIKLEELRQFVADDAPPRERLRDLIHRLVERATGEAGWHARVLSREILSPSSHLSTLQQEEILPKMRVVCRLLGEITSIPPESPAIFRCLISIAAPCAVLFIAGRALTAVASAFQAPEEALAEHLYRFAIGGLDAVSHEHLVQRGSCPAGESTRPSRRGRPTIT
ncbi:MAG: transcriptional regulator [Planctomycetaceae bacterium]|nr:transcriptional regulator [Planctomycetaceae bacterium]